MFDSLISGQLGETEIPLAGNARSLCSLKIRVGDAIKWLADQFINGKIESFRPYAKLKRRLRFATSNTGLVVQMRQSSVAATPANERPLNLDIDTIKRLIAMSNDPRQPQDARQLFSATVQREMNRKHWKLF